MALAQLAQRWQSRLALVNFSEVAFELFMCLPHSPHLFQAQSCGDREDSEREALSIGAIAYHGGRGAGDNDVET